MRYLYITLISLTILNKIGIAQEVLIASESLKKDFQVFKTSLQETHPNIYWYKTKSQMDSLFNSAENRLNRPLSENEFFDLLFGIVDSIHCGHSTVINPKLSTRSDSINLFFPFNVRILNNKLFVAQNYSIVNINLGSEIKSINGLSSSDILAKLYKYIVTDKNNISRKKRVAELTFSYMYSLYIDRPKTFELTIYNKQNNESLNVNVQAIPWDKINLNKSVVEYIGKRKPIEISFPNETTALLGLHSFEPRNLKKAGINFEDTLTKIFEQIQSKKISKLIIDLRDNRGGTLSCGYHLFSYLTKQKKFHYFSENLVTSNFAEHNISNSQFYDDKEISKPDTSIHFIKQPSGMYKVDFFSDESKDTSSTTFNGKVYLLVNGLTFSSAALFTSYCKSARPETVIIGEKPGGASEGCSGGAPVTVTLPNSKIKIFFFLVKLVLNVPDNYKANPIPVDYYVKDSADDSLIFNYIKQY